MSETLTEIKVVYSVGFKKNMGNFQSADVHLSEGETYNVEGLDADAVVALSDARYAALKEKLDDRLAESIDELSS